MDIRDFKKKIYLEHTKKIFTIFLVCLFASSPQILNAALSCSVTATCNSPDVVLFKVSNASNGHAELPSQSNYTAKVCCTGITSLDNQCTGNYAVVVKLDATTNAHIEQNTQSNYSNNACISAPGGYGITVAYQSTNCSGYDTIATSMSDVTNAHTGNQSAYTTKICLTINPPSLAFTVSDGSIGFGALSSSVSKYATGDLAGSTSETEAHTITAGSTASGGYVITIDGAALRSPTVLNNISSIGGTNTAPNPGHEQFGLRATVTSGNGTVSAPYAASGFAYDKNNFPDEVATGSGDFTTTTFSFRYVANITTMTTAATDYRTALTYTATGTF